MTTRRAIQLLLAALLLALPLGAAAQTAPAAKPAADDPVLRAMLSELERSKEKLQLKEMKRPDYIEY